MAREEEFVRREVARRLVPMDQLLALVEARAGLCLDIAAADVAEEFDVDSDVAVKALQLLRCIVGSGWP